MKLDKDAIAYIQEVVRVCRLVNLDEVVIEPDRVSAMDGDQTVLVFQDTDVPDLVFGIGLSRLSTFQTRLDIARTQDDFSVDVVLKDGTDYVHSMIMKSKGTKIDYRCMDPSKIKAPKKLNDVSKFRINLNATAVSLLQKSVSAMSADMVTFISNSEGVSFELADVTGDVFKHTFTDDVEILDDGTATKFAYRYTAKTVLSVFKENPTGAFEITSKGMLVFNVANVKVYVLPHV